MIQETDFIIQEGINHAVLNQARMDLDMTIDALAKASAVPEGTVKNIVLGKTKNPQVCNLIPICRVLNVPIEDVLNDANAEKKAIENKGIKEEHISVIALKEIYEQQMRDAKETSELHIGNIRSHYEQHHTDLKENYEKRLADKREIIDLLTLENDKLKAQLEKKEHDTAIGNLIRNCIIGLFVCGTVALLVLEFIYIEKGWITFR